MNSIEEKIKKAQKLQDEARKLWEEIRLQKQEDCPHGDWAEWDDHSLRGSCRLCGKDAKYDPLSGKWVF
jgi:hypothetical protein